MEKNWYQFLDLDIPDLSILGTGKICNEKFGRDFISLCLMPISFLLLVATWQLQCRLFSLPIHLFQGKYLQVDAVYHVSFSLV